MRTGATLAYTDAAVARMHAAFVHMDTMSGFEKTWLAHVGTHTSNPGI